MDYDDDAPAKGWNLLKWKWVRKPNETFAAAVYVALFLVMAALFAVGVWGLVQFLAPIWSEKAPGVAEPGVLRDRLIAIGALLTTPFLVWRLVVSHWSARASQEQARIAQETSRNSLFTKAVEQLGTMREERVKEETRDAAGAVISPKETIRLRPNTEVRLGAIYALEKLAREDLNMHWPIMETLCAYVRENAGAAKVWSEDEGVDFEDWMRDLKPPTVDVQAAISVIGRRSNLQQDYERKRREDGGGDAWKLDFHGAHLARVNLAGMRLAAARFDGCALHFADARMADLRGASLDRAHLKEAWLLRAHLEGTSFNKAHLERARLSEAHLETAWLSEVHLENGSLDGAHLEGASLYGAHLDRASLFNANFDDAFVAEADFTNAFFFGQEQLNASFGNAYTRISAALTRPVNERWPSENAKAKGALLQRDLYNTRRGYWQNVVEERRRTSDNS